MLLQNTAANTHNFLIFQLLQSQMFTQSQKSLNQSSSISGNWFDSQSWESGLWSFCLLSGKNVFISLTNVFIFEILKNSLCWHGFWTGLRSLLGVPDPVSDSSDSSPGRLRVFQQWKIELWQRLFLYTALRKASAILDDGESPKTPSNEGKHHNIYYLRVRKNFSDFSWGSILHYNVEPWHRGRLLKGLNLGWVVGMDPRFAVAKLKLTVTVRPTHALFWHQEDNFWMWERF